MFSSFRPERQIALKYCSAPALPKRIILRRVLGVRHDVHPPMLANAVQKKINKNKNISSVVKLEGLDIYFVDLFSPLRLLFTANLQSVRDACIGRWLAHG